MPRVRPPARGRSVADPQERFLVLALASQGVEKELIARALGVSTKALRGRYGRELDRAALEANARIGKVLFDAASAAVSYRDVLDDRGQPTGRKEVAEVRPAGVSAAIWWSKARMGWSERTELTGKNGGPLRIAHLEGIGKL